MTDLRKAAEQALEALEALHGGCTDSDDGTVEAITVWCPEVIEDLRAALAAEQAQPVAWLTLDDEGGPSMLFFDRAEALKYCNLDEEPTPLYTTPPDAVAAERDRWETAIGAVMPPDFKDWHANSPSERPAVAAWVISNLREREDELSRLLEKHNALALNAAKLRAEVEAMRRDAERLDWLLLRVSGAEFRRVGVEYSGNANRAAIDAALARAQEGE